MIINHQSRFFRIGSLLGGLLTLVLSLGFVIPGYGQDEAGPITAAFSAEKVSERIYVIHGPAGTPSPENQGFMNNPGFVLTDAGVVVIDPGSSVQVGRLVLEQVKTVTDMPIVATFSSHVHGDHWLGNQAIKEMYPEVSLYAHPNLIREAQDGAAENWVDLMNQLTEGATLGTKAIIPDLPVVDGDVITIGGIDFAIHHKGKAHTNTDIAILVIQDNTLFTGDLVFNKRLGRMDDGSFTGMSETLDHLISLAPLVVVPGHGQTSDATLLNESKRLNETLYQTVAEFYEEGLPDFEIKTIVVERLMDFQDWVGFADGVGRMVSIAYLEVEENSF